MDLSCYGISLHLEELIFFVLQSYVHQKKPYISTELGASIDLSGLMVLP